MSLYDVVNCDSQISSRLNHVLPVYKRLIIKLKVMNKIRV